MSLGATQLPLRHLSIRVPWHDSGWDGTVCRQPFGNHACMVLSNIQDNKDPEAEVGVAGRRFDELERHRLPPCITERAGFMAPFAWTRTVRHAYAAMGKPSHAHFLDTPYRHPRYSAAGVPYRWMLRKNAETYMQAYSIQGYEPERERRVDELLGFNTIWVQDRHNQLALLDTFFSAVQPQTSLCFIYAKRTPLSEDTRRVLIGAGRVTALGSPIEYLYSQPGEIRSMIWERDVLHSIRPTMEDGFLLPYHALLDASEQDPELDLARFVAFAPNDAFDSFSYVTEHVDHDQAIASLLNCAEALRRASEVLTGNWDTPLNWIDLRLNELWRLRGPCPGLGSALSAYGVEHGTFLAYELSKLLGENEDPWPKVEEVFADPATLGPEWRRRISRALAQRWTMLPAERRALLKLLSRFNITTEQATRIYQENHRRDAGIDASDADILANPYLIYERDRFSAQPIAFQTVDRGVFPDAVIRDKHPLPEPSLVDDGADARRARALMVDVLEAAAEAGNTVSSRDQVLAAITALHVQPACPLSYDLLPVVEASFDDVLNRVEMADGEPAYQLGWLAEMGALIAGQVRRRAAGRRHAIDTDWRALLDAELDGSAGHRGDALDEVEERARTEKAAALAELAAARVSVLIGPAGTGKTTMLKVLCNHPAISSGGVLLLAPTGKARVQLERRTGFAAQTIAQFLVRRGQYDPLTGRHRLSTIGPDNHHRTIIIDEASMLTEDQLAATLSAFQGAPVERLILVGDPRQLPPIGAGRPFVDIINHLAPEHIEQQFPRVGPGYIELTVNLRMRRARINGVLTKVDRRDDVLLAEWFSGKALDPGADEIWSKLSSMDRNPTLRLVKWDDGSRLHDILIDTLVEELGLQGREDRRGFEVMLGGVIGNGGFAYFNRGSAGAVERWQILTPVNLRAHGVDELNEAVQRHFRSDMLAYARSRNRRVPEPAGPDMVVYGDKVINIENKTRNGVWPREDALRYVANGEIGLVVGRTGWKDKSRPDNLWVEFSSQPGFSYDFYSSEFGDEGSQPLRLAYALTIHKAQGSEFGITLLVLPDPLPMMSRELLYTALTRQQHRVVILHQGDLHELKRFDSITYSETARRQTNLFAPPRIVRIGGAFLEEALIHRTARGVAVRSKSEVIIADRLDARGLPYAYEAPLRYGDGGVWYPDFTIEDAESGLTVYWEHLGLLHDPLYRDRWARKEAWYRAHGIVPFEEGGGPRGSLVTTRDDERGGIDSSSIDALIRQVFNL